MSLLHVMWLVQLLLAVIGVPSVFIIGSIYCTGGNTGKVLDRIFGIGFVCMILALPMSIIWPIA